MMDVAKFREMFLAEAAEHLDKMSSALLLIDASAVAVDAIDALFRSAHSIKGMAGTMGYDNCCTLSHALEDILADCRQQGRLAGAQRDLILTGIDLLEELLEDIRQERAERDISSFLQEQEQCAGGISAEGKEELPVIDLDDPVVTIRLKLSDSEGVAGPRLLVLLKTLATLGTLVSSSPSREELLACEEAPRQLQVELETPLAEEEIRAQLDRYSEIAEIIFGAAPEPPAAKAAVHDAPKQGNSVRVHTQLLDHLINLTGELITTRYHLQNAVKERTWNAVDEGVSQLTRLVKNLHRQVLKVRLVSLENLYIRLARTVHDLSRSSGKEIELELSGAEIEIDRAIVEELTDPLVHMIRNSVDHGIDKSGHVSVRAWRERDQVLIRVADDGRGIDPQAIREQAVTRGLLSAERAAGLSSYDLLQLICLPGFSTAQQVSRTSGRGVGMDVVKSSIERIGGLLEIDAAPGQGTRITLRLPLSLAIIRVLLISCNRMTMAVPISRIIQTLEVARDEIRNSGRQRVISHQGQILPLVSLRKALGYDKGKGQPAIHVVVTEILGRRVGLVVDGLIGQREVFVQRLPAPFDLLRGSNGATILGDGQIVFLLDLQSLFERFKR